MATQEMTDDELTIRHPSLPIHQDSKARITNVANGKEVEVTIIGRIAPSAIRIADLSPAAALALGFDIGKGGPVMINTLEQEGQRQLVQRGMATQEMTGGLFAAHPILPIDSKVKVTNTKNKKEITVTITDQIPPSDTRIIDLSPGAAAALDIGKGGPVIIEVLSMP
jgi:rare lipoprotein A (peptidoglycan hydrolase)